MGSFIKNIMVKMFKCNNNAFTLAEVLITLGIIGVVAAITMPMLIGQYQKVVYETGFKKEYSAISNAISYLSLEENIKVCYLSFPIGSISYSHVTTDCNTLKNSLINQLNLVKVQSVPDYKKARDVLNQGGKAINGNYTKDPNASTWYMQKDGMLINFILPEIIFDINGKKGPNKWGYDVFQMNLTPTKDGIILTDNLSSIIEKGGRFPRAILRNDNDNNQSLIRDPR